MPVVLKTSMVRVRSENMLRKLFATGLSWLWVAGLIMIIDYISKCWVINNLTAFEPLKILSIFNLTLAYNKGAAFSFLHTASGWQNMFLCVIAILISLLIIWWLYKTPAREVWFNIALSLILGGAFGNVWDRISYGYVIDFLDFHLGDWHFAIFNLADSAITVGAFMLFCYWLKPQKILSKNKF